jgi:hypothetical protein
MTVSIALSYRLESEIHEIECDLKIGRLAVLHAPIVSVAGPIDRSTATNYRNVIVGDYPAG